MRFEQLLALVGDEPVFETGLLLAGDVDPADIQRQLSRWTLAGRLVQLRKGLYALAEPYRRVTPHPFVIANRLARGSYVSTESALAHHGLIPEHVPTTTSVTMGRPGRWATDLGNHEVHHLKAASFWGYSLIELPSGQQAFVAAPEKALLDLIHLRTGGDKPAFLRELRLQNLERTSTETLQSMVERAKSPKLRRAAEVVRELMASEAEEYDTL